MTALYVVLGLWLVVGFFLTTLVLWLVYMSPVKLAFIFKDVNLEILKLEDLNDYDVKPYLLSYILENYFGFQDGVYEEEYIEGYQKTRIPSQNKVKECLRYVGYERTDDSWIKSGLASKEACELSKLAKY